MEEIEKSVSPLVLQAQEMWHFLIDGILRGLSLPQVIAIGVSLVVALLFHRWVRRLIMSVETRLEGGRSPRLGHAAVQPVIADFRSNRKSVDKRINS